MASPHVRRTYLWHDLAKVYRPPDRKKLRFNSSTSSFAFNGVVVRSRRKEKRYFEDTRQEHV